MMSSYAEIEGAFEQAQSKSSGRRSNIHAAERVFKDKAHMSRSSCGFI